MQPPAEFDDAASLSSSLSPPPESIFDFKNDEPAKESAGDGDGPNLMDQLKEMERLKMEEEERRKRSEQELGRGQEAAEAEIQVATDKKRPLKSAFPNSKTPAAKKPKFRSRKWDADFVVEDPKSPIVNVDLRALLSKPKAWSILTLEEKKQILAKFPGDQHILMAGTDDAAPNIESLRNDDNFRHDAARYTENIDRGMHDPQWLKEAWIAHERRRAGDFDEFRIAKFEGDWDVEVPEQLRLPKKQLTSVDTAMEEPDELAGDPKDVTSTAKTTTMRTSGAPELRASVEESHEMDIDPPG